QGRGVALALLSDIHQIFTQSGATRLSSKQLIDSLCAISNRPWEKARQGRPINGHWLARRLSGLGIKPSALRIGGRLAKGYDAIDFAAVFARLVWDQPPNANGDTPSN